MKLLRMITMLALTLLLGFVIIIRAGDAAKPKAEQTAPVETEEPAPEPEESPVPELPYYAEKNGMYDILMDVFENYHPGTAGSSLVGARFAASITEWGKAKGLDAVRKGAAAFEQGDTDEGGDSFQDRMSKLLFTAISMTEGELDSAGYESKNELPYCAYDVNAIFGAIFEERGWPVQTVMRVWCSNEDAESFRYYAALTDIVTSEALNEVLKDVVLKDGAALNPLLVTGDTAYIDLNSEFNDYVREMSAKEEYMLIGSIVNTVLDNTGSTQAYLTVNEKRLETWNNIYLYPVKFYPDYNNNNAAAY